MSNTPPTPREYEGIWAVLRQVMPEGHVLSAGEIEMVEKSGGAVNLV